MFVFIVCSLLLAFLVQSHSLYLPLLLMPAVSNIGWGLALSCLAAGVFKKLPGTVWRDGFVVGLLLAWYSDWQPLFNSEAPMFYVFPVYYALLCTGLALAFVNRCERFDRESRETLRHLQSLVRFDTRAIACLLLVSLMLPEHYLLYPIAMTLFVVRSTLERCLEIIEA